MATSCSPWHDPTNTHMTITLKNRKLTALRDVQLGIQLVVFAIAIAAMLAAAS